MRKLKLSRKKHSKVDFELLEQSLRLSRKLAKEGLGRGRSYSLPPPYQNKLVRTTPAELLALQEEVI
ncbi:MAG: hypothetical protein ABSG59_13995 [Verrucomicrobiota bacterium]|jgi:hypothetical protein